MAFLGQYFTRLFSSNYHIDTDNIATIPRDKKILVDKYSDYPNKAWMERRRQQRRETVETVDPDSPVSENKVRFVCISDTHSKLETSRRLKIPDGDVLLHAGDFTMFGKPDDVHIVNEYLGSLPHRHKIVIAGNHDLTFDLDYIEHTRQTWRWRLTEENYEKRLAHYGATTVHDLLTNCVYLEDSMVEIYGIKIYGSPWQHSSGIWGFNCHRGAQLLKHWDKIPENPDILLTHSPPCGYGDDIGSWGLWKLFSNDHENHVGCVDLLNTVQLRVKPKYHVFGHIHEGYGTLTDGTTTFINASTCTRNYLPINSPIVFDIPLPEGVTKHSTDKADCQDDGGLKWLIKTKVK